jgi:hypothetical protein
MLLPKLNPPQSTANPADATTPCCKPLDSDQIEALNSRVRQSVAVAKVVAEALNLDNPAAEARLADDLRRPKVYADENRITPEFIEQSKAYFDALIKAEPLRVHIYRLAREALDEKGRNDTARHDRSMEFYEILNNDEDFIKFDRWIGSDFPDHPNDLLAKWSEFVSR